MDEDSDFSDSSDEGDPVPPGCCPKCKKQIADAYLPFNQKQYHLDCLWCDCCYKTVKGEYSIQSKKPYCMDCFPLDHEGEECKECDEKVLKEGLEIDGLLFHRTCFKCHICGKQIEKKCLEASGKYYHPSCLKCFACKQPIKKEIGEKEDGIFCESCYLCEPIHECFSCKQRIDDHCFVQAKWIKWHERCFKCSRCLVLLKTVDNKLDSKKDEARFYLFRNWPYCFDCYFDTRFATKTVSNVEA